MNVKRNNRQQMKFNLIQLNKIITVLLMGRHPLISKKFLHNISSLFNTFDPNSYSEIEKSYRVSLIMKLVAKRELDNLHDREALLSYINVDGQYKEQIEQLLKNGVADSILSDDEIIALDTMIADNLAYGFIDVQYMSLIDELNKYKAEDYNDFTDWVDGFNDIISDLSYKIRTRKSATLDSKNDVSFDSDALLSNIASLIEAKKRPSAKIRTKLQAMNNMLDGGWEPGRLYLAAGVAKGWKSGWLLNAALDAKRYNKLQARDPQKKPVVLYVTQENTIKETMERVWSSLFGNDDKIEDHSPEMAIQLLQQNGIINTPGSNEAELIFKYRSNKSISTVDLDSMIEELANEGKEVVFLVHDYIKRIRPASSTTKDLRLELGDVANEMKTIAVERDIPVLTAHQLNREAFRAFDESTGVEQHFNIMKKLGAAQIGESIDIIQNVDYAFILSRTTKAEKFNDDQDPIISHSLHVKEIASRFKDNGAPKMFMHPFPDNNTMALVEDCDAVKPMSTFEVIDVIEAKTNSNKATRGNAGGPPPPMPGQSDVYTMRAKKR